MAAIDKIYGSQEQYERLYAWLYENRKAYLRYLYPRKMESEVSRPIMNAPIRVDKWLYENCPFGWLKAEIKENYSGFYNKSGIVRASDDPAYWWGDDPPSPSEFRRDPEYDKRHAERRHADWKRGRLKKDK